MLELKVAASQEVCWEIFSQSKEWRKWAPWIPLDIDRPRYGERAKLRWVGLPTPLKVTIWQPDWRWDWKCGPVTWQHLVDRLDDHHSLVQVRVVGPGHQIIERLYGPLMMVALERMRTLAEERAQQPPSGW